MLLVVSTHGSTCHGNVHFWRSYISISTLADGEHSQCYSQEGSNDAASGYQSTAPTCYCYSFVVYLYAVTWSKDC